MNLYGERMRRQFRTPEHVVQHIDCDQAEKRARATFDRHFVSDLEIDATSVLIADTRIRFEICCSLSCTLQTNPSWGRARGSFKRTSFRKAT